jgi:hypothetical protein
MQKERQRMAREQAALGEAMANEAKQRTTWRLDHNVVKPDPEHVAVSRGIVKRVAAVLASEEVNVPIQCRKSEHGGISAWTDFSQIDITYRMHEDKRLLAATLRALLYHEGGHIRWSIPFPDLVRAVKAERGSLPLPDGVHMEKLLHRAWNVLEDQRMETAVVSDSPRKAAYLTPLIMTEHTPTMNAMAANYPLLVDTAIYNQGGQIANAKFCGSNLAAGAGNESRATGTRREATGAASRKPAAGSQQANFSDVRPGDSFYAAVRQAK